MDDAAFRALLDSELPVLGNYLVGFALPAPEGKPPDALSGGTGTLVSIDETHGILTAKHVFDLLEKNRIAGLILPSLTPKDFHNVSFEIEHCPRVLLPAEGKPSQCGPDLAFFIPPPTVLSTLQAKKSFYNLSKHQDQMLKNPPALERGIWAISGFPVEWAKNDVPQRGFEKIKVFRGGFGEGKVTKEYDHCGLDFLVFEALYNDLYEGPLSFGGTSGGALWQLLGTAEDGKVRITQRLLSGVAFYESGFKPRRSEKTRDITCHGRKSLYEVFLEHVRTERRQGMES